MTSPLRAGDRRIMFSLHRQNGSLARLREEPQVALLILGADNVAFTARGRARVVEEQMARAPQFAAVLLEVESVDDHRQPAEIVESGVGVHWTDEAHRRALQERIQGLRELAEDIAA